MFCVVCAFQYVLYDFEKHDWGAGSSYYGHLIDDFEDADLNGWGKGTFGGGSFQEWEVVEDSVRNGYVMHFKGDGSSGFDSWVWSGDNLNNFHRIYFVDSTNARIGLWVKTTGSIVSKSLQLEVKTVTSNNYYYDVTPSAADSWEYKEIDLSQPDLNSKTFDGSDIVQLAFKCVDGGNGDSYDVYVDDLCVYEVVDPVGGVMGWKSWSWNSTVTSFEYTADALNGATSVVFQATLGSVGSSGAGFYCDWVPYYTSSSVDWFCLRIKNRLSTQLSVDVVLTFDANNSSNKERFKTTFVLSPDSDEIYSFRIFGPDGEIGTEDDDFVFKEGETGVYAERTDPVIGIAFDFFPDVDGQSVDIVLDDLALSDAPLDDGDAPGPPQNLDAVWQESKGCVRLSWNPPSGELPMAYFIYRSTAEISSPTDQIFLASTSSTFYEDYSVSRGVRYYYAVYSVDWFRQPKDYSQPAKAQVVIPAIFPMSFDVHPYETEIEVADCFYINFPAGCISQEAKLVVEEFPCEDAVCAYKFTLKINESEVRKLSKPGQLKLFYKESAGQVAVFYYDGYVWHNLGGKVNENERSVCVYVDHLSVYAVKTVSSSLNDFTLTAIGPNPVRAGSFVCFSMVNPKQEDVKVRIWSFNGKLVEAKDLGVSSTYIWEVPEDLEAGVYVFCLSTKSKRVKGVVVVAK